MSLTVKSSMSSITAKSSTSSSKATPSFVVNGKSLQLQLRHTPLTKLATRKIYNPAYFFAKNELYSYQHEIANHYRDYKRKSLRLTTRLLHRRRSTLYVPYRRAAGARRTVLPITVHHFPRFTAVAYARGRQTLCEDAPPDDTYNTTVRRILQANTHKELKFLVERQLRLTAKLKGGGGGSLANLNNYYNDRASRATVKKVSGFVGAKQTDISVDVNVNEKCCNYNDKAYGNNEYSNDDDNEANENSISKVKANPTRLSLSKQQNSKHKEKFNEKRTETRPTQYCLIELSTSGRKVSVPQKDGKAVQGKQAQQGGAQQKGQAKAPLNSLTNFLHLASAYYEHGYLRNINYLQAIGARNAARQNQLTLIAQHRIKAAPTSSANSSNDESATATTSAPNSLTNTPTRSATSRKAEHYLNLTRLLGRIARKRNFKVCSDSSRRPQHKLAAVPKSSENSTQISYPIRIDIKTFDGVEKIVTNKAKTIRGDSRGESSGATRTAQPTAKQCDEESNNIHDYSMNDYLNANLNTATTFSSATTPILQQQTSNRTSEVVQSSAHFNDLIDHLMQLELNDIEATSLPKITLTDCSTNVNGIAESGELAVETAQTNIDDENDAFEFEFDTNFTSRSNFSVYNNEAPELQVKVAEEKEELKEPHQKHQQHFATLRGRNAFTLKAVQFEDLRMSLEIPGEF